MTTEQFQFQSHSPHDTSRIAAELATILKPGDTLLLDGPIGAGKSHFTRSAIRQMLFEPEDIPSPTYTIVQTYHTPKGEIWHADLYRLSDPGEIDEIGLLAAFEEAICFVEWPGRMGERTPAAALTLTLSEGPEEDSRILTFSWNDPRWRSRLERVFDD